MEKERNVNLDLIRCIAAYLVLSVHFFLNNGFYSHLNEGTRMYIMTLMRTAFMVCVPLFILLTGYLMNKKELSKKYYFGIIKTLAIYLLASIACLLFRKFYMVSKFQMADYSLKESIFKILDFSAAPYSWYVSMYIGLFLIIPFLNLIYKGLKTKKQKIILICTLLFLIAAPTLLNIFDFLTPGWWTQPKLSNKYNKLIPDWWGSIYPIMYYFIGAFLSEYKLKIKKSYNILFFLYAVVIFGSFNYYRSTGATFVWGPYTNWGGFESVITSVLLFIFMSNLNLSKIPAIVKKIFAKIANVSLGIYLVSWIFDGLVYYKLNLHVPEVPNRLEYYFIVVPIIFTGSLALALILDYIYKFIRFAIRKIIAFRLQSLNVGEKQSAS